MYLNELEAWAMQQKPSETTNQTPYCLGSFFDYNNKRFCIFMTSKVLLNALNHAEICQADGTYKLNWLGYPVIVLGATDCARVIFCFISKLLGFSSFRNCCCLIRRN